MRRSLFWLAVLAPGLLPAQPQVQAAANAHHPVVAPFERFYTSGKADAARGGQLLLGELNCVSCHQPADDQAVSRKQAPLLDDVGTRVRVGYLRKFLSDPQAVKPGTTMPRLFAGDADRDQKVEALVHFLASTDSLRHERPNPKSVAAGRDLFQKVGCVACHGPRDAAGNALPAPASAVPLGDLKAKYSLTSLAAFLDNPLRVRPSARMPHLVSGKDAKDVASYLLQGLKAEIAESKGATRYAYFEGSWDRVPDFGKLKPRSAGVGYAFDLSSAQRGNDFAFQFEGYFKADRDGTYTFTLHSDDGSKLSIDGQKVVDNDGVHAPKAATGSVKLTRGVHKVEVGFFQVGGGAELDVQVAGPGVPQQPLGGLVADSRGALEKLANPPRKQDDEDYLDVQPALAARGKELFASAGCASCHTLKADSKPVVSTLKAPPLARLKPAGGCLSANPPAELPAYSLSPAQGAALAAAIKSPPAAPKEPAAVIAHTMTVFNCYACHARDKVGGPDEDTNRSFITSEPEMGDEARVPPPLDGVGAKLNPDYLRQILDKGAKDRPYMLTKMPGFGLANVGPIADAFAALDKLPAGPAVQFAEPVAKVKVAGRHMVGNQAFGCIKCHTFNGHKAEGVQGIDMTLMPKRVQHDWYYLYLLDPMKLRPGTRMPTAWPNGKSVLPEILDGKAATQINAIWVYLKDGSGAQLPVGMQKHSIPLVARREAIIYRNFIQGAGNRAIGVGYPEGANLAFDANELRLAMLWQGAFIDAGRHWTDRGAGSEPPLGDNILHLHGGAAFAVLAKPDAAWPTAPPKEQGYKFLGYRLTPDERPTFFYSFGDVKVEDTPSPIPGKEVTLKRVLKLSAPQAIDNLYFRAAFGSKIEALNGGWYRIDGWKMKVEGGPAQVRQSGGKAELLVPVRFADGKAQVTQEYAW
jgi:mono/diheme cytochrome c family protein